MDVSRRCLKTKQCKVVLLGDAGSGKTCLLQRFLHNTFDVNTKPTVGAAFGAKMLNTDNGTVSLQLWDTAGQERYLALASLYYRNAQAAIVCCDMTDTKSFQRMEYWIKEVRNAERNCKIYVCGTKADLIWDNFKPRAIRSEDLTIFKAQSIETSSKANYNVFSLFQKVADDAETFQGDKSKNISSSNLSLSDEKPSVNVEERYSCCQSQ